MDMDDFREYVILGFVIIGAIYLLIFEILYFIFDAMLFEWSAIILLVITIVSLVIYILLLFKRNAKKPKKSVIVLAIVILLYVAILLMIHEISSEWMFGLALGTLIVLLLIAAVITEKPLCNYNSRIIKKQQEENSQKIHAMFDKAERERYEEVDKRLAYLGRPSQAEQKIIDEQERRVKIILDRLQKEADERRRQEEELERLTDLCKQAKSEGKDVCLKCLTVEPERCDEGCNKCLICDSGGLYTYCSDHRPDYDDDDGDWEDTGYQGEDDWLDDD